MYSLQEIFQQCFQCKKVHTILNKIWYLSVYLYYKLEKLITFVRHLKLSCISIVQGLCSQKVLPELYCELTIIINTGQSALMAKCQQSVTYLILKGIIFIKIAVKIGTTYQCIFKYAYLDHH